MVSLVNKKVIIIGDRDGIPGLAIEECVKPIEGVEVVFSSTECFVWTAAGAMDLENQKRIKEAAEKFGNENLVVLLGAAEAEAAGLAAETVTVGDQLIHYFIDWIPNILILIFYRIFDSFFFIFILIF